MHHCFTVQNIGITKVYAKKLTAITPAAMKVLYTAAHHTGQVKKIFIASGVVKPTHEVKSLDSNIA